MPTSRVLTMNRERSVSTLARRMFEIRGGRAGSADLARAEAAILRANPGLATAEGFGRGRAVVVPAGTGLRLRDDVKQPDASGEALGQELDVRLISVASKVEGAFAQAEKRKADVLEQSSARAFRAAATRALPESAEVLTEARRNLSRQAERDKEARETMARALSQAREDLSVLQSLIRPRISRSDNRD